METVWTSPRARLSATRKSSPVRGYGAGEIIGYNYNARDARTAKTFLADRRNFNKETYTRTHTRRRGVALCGNPAAIFRTALFRPPKIARAANALYLYIRIALLLYDSTIKRSSDSSIASRAAFGRRKNRSTRDRFTCQNIAYARDLRSRSIVFNKPRRVRRRCSNFEVRVEIFARARDYRPLRTTFTARDFI